MSKQIKELADVAGSTLCGHCEQRVEIHRLMRENASLKAEVARLKSSEEPKRKYTYTDHSVKEYLGNGMWGKAVFVCTASGILEADAMYMDATGKNPVKQQYVGVQVL